MIERSSCSQPYHILFTLASRTAADRGDNVTSGQAFLSGSSAALIRHTDMGLWRGNKESDVE